MPSEPHEHEWERGVHMAEAFGIDGRVYGCAICGIQRIPTPSRIPKPTPASGDAALDDDYFPPASIIRNLEACKPLYNARGPGPDKAPTFSGWEVPDWLMQRVRAALTPQPAETTLDAAWAAVEDALPEGWGVGIEPGSHGGYEAGAGRNQWFVWDGQSHESLADALTALAARLAQEPKP